MQIPSAQNNPTQNPIVAQFLDYFDKVRARTLRLAKCIPPDKLEWTFKPGRFTLGDLLRHLAGVERYMWAENARFLPSRYPGHARELADGYDAVFNYMSALHADSMAIFTALTDADLLRKCSTPDGASITLWKWLRLMAEHEIHHRGQIYLYLAMLDVPTPPLYGLTEEQVRERSK
jgi:uncharacterized damage-inducible protein DinB